MAIRSLVNSTFLQNCDEKLLNWARWAVWKIKGADEWDFPCTILRFGTNFRLAVATILEVSSKVLILLYYKFSCLSSLFSYFLCEFTDDCVQYLGYTPGLFIVGLFVILILWMYTNFWITGLLFIVGDMMRFPFGYLFSLNHARLVVLMAALYAIYCVKIRVGWLSVFLSINLESEKPHSCKSSSKPPIISVIKNPDEASASKVVKEQTNLADEMRRILDSNDHYEALGFPRHIKIEVVTLKKEYRKEAMLVHPDRNMGSPLASESFKKIQCAYEVLSDFTKKRDYDEHLRKEESRTRSVCQKSHSTSNQRTIKALYFSSYCFSNLNSNFLLYILILCVDSHHMVLIYAFKAKNTAMSCGWYFIYFVCNYVVELGCRKLPVNVHSPLREGPWRKDGSESQ
ncbi:hypothetical protein UlMin_012572 [Ulmus minor]